MNLTPFPQPIDEQQQQETVEVYIPTEEEQELIDYYGQVFQKRGNYEYSSK